MKKQNMEISEKFQDKMNRFNVWEKNLKKDLKLDETQHNRRLVHADIIMMQAHLNEMEKEFLL